MPSGAKKRKATKKKNQKAAQQVNHDNENLHAHGNDDPRSQEERESDDGSSSQASHDHENHQNPFIEGTEGAEKTDTSPGQSLVINTESVKEATGTTEVTGIAGLVDEDTIRIEGELKPEENIEITDSSVEHDRSSSSSSSSSSDDESQEMKKKPEKEDFNNSAFEVIRYNDVDKPTDSLAEKAMRITRNAPLPDASVNTILETAPLVDSTKPTGSATEEHIRIEAILDDTLVDDTLVVSDVKPVSGESEKKSYPKLNLNADKDSLVSDENAGASSGVTSSDLKENEGKTLPLSDTVAESNDIPERVKESEILESSEKEPLVEPTHPVVRRTSWLSCCGLFDVIMGSNR